MAAYVSPAVPEVARSFLSEAKTLRFLGAFVRRRVPAASRDDVVQSVLCSALEAAPPAAPEALPRWLTGIARHKIADFHRRAARERGNLAGPAEPRWDDPIEARDLIARANALIGEPERRTFEWMLRTHEGDALEDIAREEALPAPVVRQRVTRLRRVLRGALGVAAALVLTLALRHPAPESIRPEPAASSAGAGGPLAMVQGRWRVTVVSCGPDVPATGCLAARAATLEIHGTHATVVIAGLRRDALLRSEGGVLRAMLDPDQASELRIVPDGDRLEVSSKLGSFTLARE